MRPEVVNQGRQPVERSRGLGAHFFMIIAAIAIIGVVTWIVAGALFAVLHVIEVLVVAGAAGWAGYRLGHYRGRKRGG